jgi:CubicO group peptidase (beta-lactamase class C family)
VFPSSQLLIESALEIGLFENFIHRPPIHGPATTPAYSNTAFQILTYCLEKIVGQTYSTIFKTNLTDRLDLKRTTLWIPANSSFTAQGYIPIGIEESGWLFDAGDEAPYVQFLFSVLQEP